MKAIGIDIGTTSICGVVLDSENGDTLLRDVLVCVDFENPDYVAYYEQNKMFVMVFFLEENDFIFFKSYNLTDWTFLCTFTLEGDRVCSDLYTLKDGDKTRWVLSAGQNVYVTADMDAEKGLVNVSKPKKFGFGAMYAAQSPKKTARCLDLLG